MARRIMLALAMIFLITSSTASLVQAQERAYGRVWGAAYGSHDWERFYHYPYVYYPQNFWGNEYFRSGQSLYHRYPTEMRVPVYNRKWHNFYPQGQRYHFGHHFQLDVY